MKIIINERFEKEALKLRNSKLQNALADLIESIQNLENSQQVKGLKRLKGVNAYRIRLGDYRLGIILENDETIEFISVGHRKEFYRSFP